MDTKDDDDGPAAMLRRLEAATNAHDLEGLTDCFTADYENETPAHPARGFSGRQQVHRNWQTIFAGVPDLHARVLRSVSTGNEVWSEWEMSGHRRDGAEHLMRGIIIFTVSQGRASRARFYLEPVDAADSDVNAAVGVAVGTGP
jgi:ketosteroid isomerase-like protein